MRVNAPPISAHRLQRLQRWMVLWLNWFAALLSELRVSASFSAQATAAAHQWLDRIERVLTNVVILRAAPLVRGACPPKHSARRRIEAHRRRAIIGSALRRTLRAKDLHQRIAALSQNVDRLVARLLKRLPRGLTRRRPHRTRPEALCIVRASVESAFAPLADTS